MTHLATLYIHLHTIFEHEILNNHIYNVCYHVTLNLVDQQAYSTGNL